MSVTTELARPNDLRGLPPEEMAAITFLASFPNQHTRETYRINLRLWFQWLAEHAGIRPFDAGRAHIEVYARWLEETDGKRRSTVAQKLNSILGFYKAAKREGLIVDNPGDFVRRPSVPRQTTSEYLERKELLAVLEYASQHDTQDAALLYLLGFNGLRISEACRLDIEDLIRVRGRTRVKVQRSKGELRNTITLYPSTAWAIDLHLGSRATGPVFVKRTGERMDGRSANRIVRRNVRAVGITRRITCHSFRHSFVTHCINAGVLVGEIQRNLCWKDLRNVAYYDHGNDDPARDPTNLLGGYIEMS